MGYGCVAHRRPAVRRAARRRSACTSSTPTTARRSSTAARPRRSTTLEHGSRRTGCDSTDIRHLLLSHIHLDHAGAAGTIVQRHPELTVWVSPVGAPHVVDPSRLERSARRLYGDLFDPLWGELAARAQANVRIAKGDMLGWEAFPTVGHATHHVRYLLDGTLLAGDAAACACRRELRAPGFPAARSRRRGLARDGAGDPRAQARAHRADPFRRHRGRRHASRHVRLGARPLGRTRAGRHGPAGVQSKPRTRRHGADAGSYDKVAPFWQSWPGIEALLSKR